ncbi:hypothetical protein EOL70_21585 [Leucothrix sargassi]|nr:hypothetical protein EOL70_21585 [Leucothrix sargassi]
MANQITLPAGNTQNDLQRQIDRLESELYDNTTLALERVLMLEAIINDTIHALSEISSCIPKQLQKTVSTRLGIGQLLAMDFIQSLSNDIAELEGKA